MNVIVSNKQKNLIDNANIDAIKDLNGLFNVDDLINKFKNYFFSKMILDATSVVDFTSDVVLSKLANSIGSERLFILLPNAPAPPESFIKSLNNLRIYNYSTDINELVELINNPRNGMHNDVPSDENFYVDNSVKNNNIEEKEDNIKNDFYSNMNIVNNSLNNNSMTLNINSNDESIYNTNNNINTTNNSDTNNNITNNSNTTNNNTFVSSFNDSNKSFSNSNIRIIGFKNVTSHAGSTSLVYMLTRKLVNTYGKKAVALEINKNDFKYYQEKIFINSSESELAYKIKNSNSDIILVDLNDCKDISFCDDVIYLVEPSIIKLNMVMMSRPFTFRDLKDKNVVLNKSLLSNSDVHSFEGEAGLSFLFNMPPLNDRIENKILDKFLDILKLI